MKIVSADNPYYLGKYFCRKYSIVNIVNNIVISLSGDRW